MKIGNKLLVCTIFLFLFVISSGIVFADDNIPSIETGEVSGDVVIVSENPFESTNGELVYEIPANVSEIKSAYAVVSSYSGSGQPTYALTTNISLKTNNGVEVLEYANLTYPDSTANDPVIYPITNFTSKQYSDYQSLFNITNQAKKLSGGDTISISVNNAKMDNYSFDGRIKLIALIFAYDDDDNDKVTYWLNIGQSWTKGTLSTVFNTKKFEDEYEDVTLESIALSSADATYRLNGELLSDPTQKTGNYYIYDVWDILDKFQPGNDTNFTYTSSQASTYASYKAAVQLLKINTPEKYYISPKITPPYTGTIFAGVNNTITVDIENGNNDFNGSVKLLIGEKEIASIDSAIGAKQSTQISFTDPSIRPIDETTVNGANNTVVTYTLNILDNIGNILNTTNASYKVLYNGNLGKDFAYPASNASVNRIYNITGDAIVLTQDDSTYMGSGVTSQEFTFDVTEKDIYESLLYVSYNWDKIAEGDFNTWNITFNNVAITPIANYRDQSNLGTYGNRGYGLVVYNVTDLMGDGNNTLVLNKTNGNAAVYPATLLVLTNNNESETYKEVYIAENADLLSKPENLESGSYTFMNVTTDNLLAAGLYVFSASAQSGEGNIIFNENKTFENVWNGSSSSMDFAVFDITDSIKNENTIYFQATGSTIVALPTVIFCEKSIEKFPVSATITPPYSGTIFAGVNNTITADIENGIKDLNGSVELLIGGEKIASQEIVVDANNTKELTFTDPTIRPIDETTVNGANNTQVTYTLNILDKYGNILNSTNATFKVLYNGNLGKDFAYPASNATVNRIYKITGDVIVLTQDDSTYMSSSVTSQEFTFNVTESDINESLLYVAYNWDKIAEGDFNTWNITFNNVAITPIANYRDQSNLGTYGNRGYGLVVYNVTDLMASGENILVLNKTNGNAAVYPATLLVLTNNNESETYKEVYIAENADLLSKPVNLESGSYTFMDVDKTDFINSTLYVFAASAQSGDGNIIINGNTTFENVWNGSSNSLDYYTIDMTNLTSQNNVVYFQSSGSTIVALQDILVLEFEDKSVQINVPDVEKYFNGSERLYVLLTDSKGNPIAGENVVISINGVKYTRTTDENGSTSLSLNLNTGKYIAEVSFNGTENYDSAQVNATVTIKATVNGTDVVKVFRNATQYHATFRDSEGNYLKDGEVVRFNINGVMYDRTVSGGKGLASLNINLEQGEYIITAKNLVTGEESANIITVIPRIINNNDLVKYYRNGSQYVVQIIGDDGNPVGANEIVTFNINGVMYTRTTNESGHAQLNINLQPGDYIITAMYGECMVSNNITVKTVLSAENLIMNYQDGSTFNATLLDGQGNPFARQNIQFNVNGVMYIRTTDSQGVARLNINLMPGQYIITSSYNELNIGKTITING